MSLLRITQRTRYSLTGFAYCVLRIAYNGTCFEQYCVLRIALLTLMVSTSPVSAREWKTHATEVRSRRVCKDDCVI